MLPRKSRGVVDDLRNYFFHEPEISTLIQFPTRQEREDYSHRILQRLGIRVDRYSILNIHQISIRAPVRFVHEEMLEWNGDSPYWPNHLATVESIEGDRRRIKIRLLGHLTSRLSRWLRWQELGTLFRLEALKFQNDPDPDFDNARYFLYDCSGGYPIGIYFQYVRSPVADQGESEETQLFFVVGFDFYGQQRWPRWAGRLWEKVHNRVTANILNRFRALCHAGFRDFTSDSEVALEMARRVRGQR
jgi:hypothetical protein